MVNIDKTSGLKYFTIADFRSWCPDYDLSKHFSKDFKGTAIDIIRHKDICFVDKLPLVLRTEVCSDKLMRLFAVYCYRDTLNWVKNPDPRSIEAANVAERFANNKATEQELLAAESAAWSAARSATESAAWSAARLAAWSAAQSAAQLAAWSAWSASAAAESAAWSARSAAQERYINKLIEMLKVEAAETLFDIVATA